MWLLPLQYKGEVFHAYDAALRIGIKKQHPEHGAVQEETARAVAAVRRMGVHEIAVELALHPLLCAAGQGLGHLWAPGQLLLRQHHQIRGIKGQLLIARGEEMLLQLSQQRGAGFRGHPGVIGAREVLAV